MLDAATGANRSLPLYPRAFLEPKNGWIFIAGGKRSRDLKSDRGGSVDHGPAGPTGSCPSRSYGSAVMLDSKVFMPVAAEAPPASCPPRSNSAEIIDLAAAAPTWTTGLDGFRRRQTNATILADGTVLVTGGTGTCGFTNESGAVFAAEIYEPRHTGPRWPTPASGYITRRRCSCPTAACWSPAAATAGESPSSSPTRSSRLRISSRARGRRTISRRISVTFRIAAASGVWRNGWPYRIVVDGRL